MNAAVAELTVVKVGLFGTFARQLCHASHSLAFPFRLLDLPFNNISYIAVDMQIVVYLLLDEVADELVDRFAPRSHLC